MLIPEEVGTALVELKVWEGQWTLECVMWVKNARHTHVRVEPGTHSGSRHSQELAAAQEPGPSVGHTPRIVGHELL